MRKTKEGKTIVFGFTNSIIEIWRAGKLLKRFKMEFKLFDMDDLGSCFVFLNHKCRDLEFHAIEWEWDTRAVQQKMDALGSDEEGDESDDIEGKLNEAKRRDKTACCAIF